MQFPKFPRHYKQSAPRPIEGYISFVAQNNSGHDVQPGELHAKRLQDTHVFLGHACVELSRGNVLTANNMLKDVQVKVEAIARDPGKRGTKLGRHAAQTLLTTKMLSNFENSGVTEPLRRQMHTGTVGNVRKIKYLLTNEHVELSSGARDVLNGELVEQTALGILTRYAHPRVMAMPALIFQDEGTSRRKNYDMVFVETFEDQMDPRQSLMQKVQVKSRCFDFCDQGVDPRDYRHEYEGDIILFSGCCDLGMRGSVDNPARYEIPDMLIREVAGKATPDDIAALDKITNTALFNLTIEDERRLGKLPINHLVSA
jgi:hypothetical protein